MEAPRLFVKPQEADKAPPQPQPGGRDVYVVLVFRRLCTINTKSASIFVDTMDVVSGGFVFRSW